MKITGFYRTVLSVNVFINGIFCAVCPPLLLALGANWLCRRFGWSRLLLAAAVLLGTAVGAKSMWNYLKRMTALEERTDTPEQNRNPK